MRDRSLCPTTRLTGNDLADAGLPVAFHRRDLEAALRCSARSASDLIRRLTDEGTIVPVKYKRDRPKKQRLYALAGEYAGLTGEETVWDLYCGTGTIGLTLAKQARSVWGIEIS